MPIPDFQTLMLPVLRHFAEGAQNVAQMLPSLQKEFEISDEEAAVMNPSGTMTTFANRTHWARTYLSKAGLLSSPGRNRHQITQSGRSLLESGIERIDLKTLEQFPVYMAWREKESTEQPGAIIQEKPDQMPARATETPEERIEKDYNSVNSSLVDDLIAAVRSMHPVKFERLILDLLTRMGYGAGDLANSQMTKTTGDGGIDGIINEDALGLDAVYIQAKRYAPDSKVGRPALQAFVGSLTGEGATKGVFVTTSDFSKEARDYLNKVQHRIVLINGERLARLMIQHEVGVRARKTYVLRSVDEDCFAEV